MTAHFARPDPEVVASATIIALMEARWESSDLLSRRSAELAPDLLRGHASELATSPIGRDQLLSVALEAAAADLQAGRPALAKGALFLRDECAPELAARNIVRRSALNQGGVPLAESQRVADEVEQRQRRECIELRELSRRLLAEARLHESLWDDPRLNASSRTRLVMLCSVPRLLERAEELDPSRAKALRQRDATGKVFQELAAKLKEAAGEQPEQIVVPTVDNERPDRGRKHLSSNAWGWLILIGLLAAVLVGLIAIG